MKVLIAEKLAATLAERVAGGRPLKGEVVLLIAPPDGTSANRLDTGEGS